MATKAQPTFTYNHDISGLYRRFNRFITEMVFSVSSGGSQVNSFDQVRLSNYIAAIRSYQDWVESQPQLDLPETHPKEYPLVPTPEVPDLENESVVDFVNLLVVARDELVSSQSTRDAAGLKPFDSVRLTANINKLDAFLNTYVQDVTPLDLPESSPQTEMTGSGSTGI